MDDPPKKRVSLPIHPSDPGAGNQTLLDRAELGDDAEVTRGPWSWVLLGVMAIFVVLVPLAMLVMALLRRVYASSEAPPIAPLVAGSVAAIAIACLSGGFLVGRFGPRMTAPLGAATGALAGVVLWALSRTLLGGIVVVLTTPLSALGAHLGRKQRRK